MFQVKATMIGFGGDEKILEKGLENVGLALDELGGAERS